MAMEAVSRTVKITSEAVSARRLTEVPAGGLHDLDAANDGPKPGQTQFHIVADRIAECSGNMS